MKLAPILKATYIALKYGSAAARAAGFPVPDVSTLIPTDVMDIGGKIVTALKGSDKAMMEDDSAIVDAVRDGRVGAARLRPAMLQGEELALVKSLFGDVVVC